MYRCKIGKGINKGLHGLKIVISAVFLLCLLSYSSILQDTYSSVTLDHVQNTRYHNENAILKTTTHVTDTTIYILVSTGITSSSNDHILNKEDRKNEDNILNEDDRISNEDGRISNEDDRILDEDDRTLSKEDTVNEENRVLNKKDRITRADDRTLNKEDHELKEEVLTVSEEYDIKVKEDDSSSSNEERITNKENHNKHKDLMIDKKDRIAEENLIRNEHNRNESKVNLMINEDDLTLNEDMINEKFFGENRKIKVIGCRELFKKNMSGAHRARKIVNEELPSWTTRKYKEKAANCSSFINERGYITHHLTTEEKLFPIAYSILMYKNVEQVERLLRAIYRPQNIYCIHVDKKTNNEIYEALSSIGQCFENVFVLNKRVNVIWGKMSVLTPELLCMEELWKRHKTWKYFINLTGQEFPLKTNYELVKILQAYNGANDVEATVKQFTERCRGKSRVRPPHGIRVTKGAVHVAVTRGYVDYVLHDHRARNILKWMSYSCDIPDEAFFTTLNHNPHLRVPGSFKGFPETTPLSNTKKPFLARYKNRIRSPIHRWPCHGKWVRGMCIFNYLDLHQLSTRKELFANKFHLYDNPLPYACMEELIFNRTRDEFQGTRTFDASWYSTLGFVKRHIK